MKLLMIYMERMAYHPAQKTLDDAEDMRYGDELTNVLTAFIHVEKEDEDDLVKKEKKLVKNLKWAANKNNTVKLLLHSFAHLSESKADPDITKGLFDRVEERLKVSGYQISQTPFGYFLDLEIKTPGYSLARIFKDL